MKNLTRYLHMKNIFVLLTATLLAVTHAYAANEKNSVTHISQEKFVEKTSTAGTAVVIDVRTSAEFSRGHIPSAINIPHANILNNISLLDDYRGRDMILYCHSGARVKKVTDYLSELNFSNIYHLKGDFRAWQGSGRPIEK